MTTSPPSEVPLDGSRTNVSDVNDFTNNECNTDQSPSGRPLFFLVTGVKSRIISSAFSRENSQENELVRQTSPTANGALYRE